MYTHSACQFGSLGLGPQVLRSTEYGVPCNGRSMEAVVCVKCANVLGVFVILVLLGTNV